MTSAEKSAAKVDSDVPMVDKAKTMKSNHILDKKRLVLLLFSAMAFEVSDDIANVLLGVDGGSDNSSYLYLLYFVAVFVIGDLVLKSYRKNKKADSKKLNVEASLAKFMPAPREENVHDDSSGYVFADPASERNQLSFKTRAAKRMAFKRSQELQTAQGTDFDDPRTDGERRLEHRPCPRPRPSRADSKQPVQVACKECDADTIARALDDELRAIAAERASNPKTRVPEWRRPVPPQDRQASRQAPAVAPRGDTTPPVLLLKNSEVAEEAKGETMVWCSRWHDPNEEVPDVPSWPKGIDNRPFPKSTKASSRRDERDASEHWRRKEVPLEQVTKAEQKASKAKVWKPKEELKGDVPIHM